MHVGNLYSFIKLNYIKMELFKKLLFKIGGGEVGGMPIP